MTMEKELERKLLLQEVIDRILKYDENYIQYLREMNEKFPINKEFNSTKNCFSYKKAS